jgi:hypothetical protein
MQKMSQHRILIASLLEVEPLHGHRVRKKGGSKNGMPNTYIGASHVEGGRIVN